MEEMYCQISELLQRARKKKRTIILGVDWNAVVQAAAGDFKESAVGAFANVVGNARGEMLASWACKEGMILANAMFKKRKGRIWTHIQNGRKRQIDYLMVEKRGSLP